MRGRRTATREKWLATCAGCAKREWTNDDRAIMYRCSSCASEPQPMVATGPREEHHHGPVYGFAIEEGQVVTREPEPAPKPEKWADNWRWIKF